MKNKNFKRTQYTMRVNSNQTESVLLSILYKIKKCVSYNG